MSSCLMPALDVWQQYEDGPQESGGNDDAIPVHRPAPDVEGHPVQVEFQTQAGKGDGSHHASRPDHGQTAPLRASYPAVADEVSTSA